jgi:hypothetical protein
MAWVRDSTDRGSLKWKAWLADSTRACSMRERASACRPDRAQPMWEEMGTSFSMEEERRRGDVERFSTPRRMPDEVATCSRGGEGLVQWG